MISESERERLAHLVAIVQREVAALEVSDRALFANLEWLSEFWALTAESPLTERIDAFLLRFARLQDALGDKLLPAVLRLLAEPPRAMRDRLDFAERMGWVASSDEWLVLRELRNQMVHEYLLEPHAAVEALLAAHRFVPALIATANALIGEVSRRGWLPSHHPPI
ncbi:hypothetical protein [Hydrogenophilus thiooxidans]|uniref:hypothetical protein n=1 Tax=Hydrogenophilus thiooxidans TaxID=2820326 RepID=UPI001C24DBD3|nr:hypothetical protein [Hydrogenophilus thiooxidans]